jgi:hypothetical protein
VSVPRQIELGGFRWSPGSQIRTDAKPRNEDFHTMSNPVSHLAKAALDTLHGARGLPPREAIIKLRDFLKPIDTTVPDGRALRMHQKP